MNEQPKNYLFSYPDGSKHYLTSEQFDRVAKAFLSGQSMAMLPELELLLTDKFTWAGRILPETFEKPKTKNKVPFLFGNPVTADGLYVLVDGERKEIDRLYYRKKYGKDYEELIEWREPKTLADNFPQLENNIKKIGKSI